MTETKERGSDMFIDLHCDTIMDLTAKPETHALHNRPGHVSLDKMQAGENVFFHDIPLIGIEAMKEDVKSAIRIFSGEA